MAACEPQSQAITKSDEEENKEQPADDKVKDLPKLKPGVYTERENAFRLNLDETKTEALEEVETAEGRETLGPYFRAFSKRRRDHKDLLSKQETEEDGDFSAEQYLKKVIAKYDVPFDFSQDDFPMATKPAESDDDSPWIQGIMRKKVPPNTRKGLFGWFKSAYHYKFMRLYADALLWFEVPSWRVRHGWTRDATAKPEGVLPLALISGVKAPGLAEIMAYDEEPLKDGEAIPEIDDTALTVLELELGKGQGIVKLRAEDWRQRLKWLECLNIAIFDSDKKGRGAISRISKLTQDVLKVSREPASLKEIQEEDEDDSSHSSDVDENGVLKLASGLFAVVGRDKVNTIRASETKHLPVV